MKEIILANARYWLKILQAASNDAALLPRQLRNAAKAIEAAMQIPEIWDTTRLLAQALHPHMEQYGHWADWDECLQVLVICAQGQNDVPAEAEILLWRSIILRQQGEFQAATRCGRRAWRMRRLAKTGPALASFFSQLGDTYRLRWQFWSAETLCRAAVYCSETEDSLLDLAQAENRLGLVYFDQLRFSEALPHFTRSEALWRQINHAHGLAKVLQNLGEMHRRTKDFDQALTYLGQAVECYLKAGDEISAARTRLNIGNVFLNQGDLLSAVGVYLQAETTLLHVHDSIDLAGTRLNLGIVYTRLKNWSEAEACLMRALEQWRIRGDIWEHANTLGEIGMLFWVRGEQGNAKNYLDEAWELAKEREGPRFDLLRRELGERRSQVA